MALNDFLPFFAMVFVQLGYAGMTLLSKLAMDSGMNPFVHVAYREFFATIVIAPVAYFMERRSRPPMTLPILFQIFLSSIFGATMNQTLFFVGLHNSTPTIASALSNLLPALTFLLALPLRLENLGIRRRSGLAKVLGTTVCVGGAALLSFYHGGSFLGQPSIQWEYAHNMGKGNPSNHDNFFLGPFLVIASTLSGAVWFLIQARLSETYAAPYTTSALICFMASIQCGIIAVVVKHDVSSWSLSPSIRVVSSVYAGTVCTAGAFCLLTWCIQRKGPLYVSVFSPLQLIIVALVSWTILHEHIYNGTAVGSILIVIGLYAVLWGKNRETIENEERTRAEDEVEMQEPFPESN